MLYFCPLTPTLTGEALFRHWAAVLGWWYPYLTGSTEKPRGHWSTWWPPGVSSPALLCAQCHPFCLCWIAHHGPPRPGHLFYFIPQHWDFSVCHVVLSRDALSSMETCLSLGAVLFPRTGQRGAPWLDSQHTPHHSFHHHILSAFLKQKKKVIVI